MPPPAIGPSLPPWPVGPQGCFEPSAGAFFPVVLAASGIMFGMPSMMGYAMPSSSLMSSLVASSYLAGRVRGKKTKPNQTKKNQQNKRRSESPGFALRQPLSLDAGQPELLSRGPPPLTSAAAWRAGTPGTAAGTARPAAASPSPSPSPAPAPAPARRRSLPGHRRPPPAARRPLRAGLRRPTWPPTRAAASGAPAKPPRAALRCAHGGSVFPSRAPVPLSQVQWVSRGSQVSFAGEAGVDEGGPCRELFNVAARTLCQPSTGAFRRLASGLAWFHSQDSSCEHTFLRIGTLCGMALYNGCTAPFPFPRALYKKLLDLSPTLEDLEELLPTTGRNLRGILHEECDHILESLDLNFTIMEEGGSMVTVELKKNGANIPVTKENRKEFVDLYVDYVFNESVQKPFQDFMEGFLRGCPARKWKMFFPAELQIVLQGHTKVDWHLLEKNVMYKRYKKLDRTIMNFWTVFHKLPEEKKKMFFAFLTGSDQIPGYGLEYFQFSIADPQAENPDEYYPFANTCSCILFLPRYSSKKILKKRLLYATEHNEKFGLP